MAPGVRAEGGTRSHELAKGVRVWLQEQRFAIRSQEDSRGGIRSQEGIP